MDKIRLYLFQGFVLYLFLSATTSFAVEWQQYRTFGGRTLEGDIKTIIADMRYVYAFSLYSGTRYDKLLDKWEFSFINNLPTEGYQFVAADYYFNDLYFVYYDRMVPYRTVSNMQYPAIELPEKIMKVAFNNDGVWVITIKGAYICDRWNRTYRKIEKVPDNLTWNGELNNEALRRDGRLYFLADPMWDDWAGLHYLTAYAEEFASDYVWAAYSGLGLWRYDLITKEKIQITKGFLASKNVADLSGNFKTIGLCGEGGLTFINLEKNSWQQLGKLFNIDLNDYQLRCLAFNEKKIFIGTNRGIIVLKNGDDFATTISEYEGLPGNKINTLLLKADSLWIGTEYGPALYSIKSGAKVNKWEGQGETAVYHLATDHNYLYMATSRGGLILNRSDSMKIFRYDTNAPMEINREIFAVFTYGSDVWWLSPEALLVYNKIKQQWKKYPLAGNYSPGRGNSLEVDEQNVWIGSDAGLLRFIKSSGQWIAYGKGDGLLDNKVCSILSQEGRVWVGSDSGLCSYDWQNEQK